MKYKTLIVEDKDTDWIDFISGLLQQLGAAESNIFKTSTQLGALDVISENTIDLAFVDITLPIKVDQGPEIIDAGLEIIRKIAENCIRDNQTSLIFLFSNNINDAEVDAYKAIVNLFKEQRIIQIPKIDLQSQKGRLHLIPNIFKQILYWHLECIRKINDPYQWRVLLKAMATDYLTSRYIVQFQNNEWKISDFLLPEVTYEGNLYLSHNDIIENIKGLISYPKIGPWGDNNKWGQFTEIYFKFLELDEKEHSKKLSEIEELSNKYIINFIEILLSNKSEGVNLAKRNELNFRQILQDPTKIKAVKDIDPLYFDNLIIRNVILALCKLRDTTENHNWNQVPLIIDLFDRTPKRTRSTETQFMLRTGFKTRNRVIVPLSYTSELFYKEREFLDTHMSIWQAKILQLRTF